MAVQSAVSVIIGAELGGTFKGAFGNAKSQLATLGGAIKNLDKASENAKSFVRLKDDTAKAKTEWQSAEQRMKALSDEITRTDKPSKELRDNFRAASKEAAVAKQAYDNNSSALRDMGKQLTDAGVNTKALTAEQNKLGSALETLKKRQSELARIEDAKARNIKNRNVYKSQIMDVVALGTAIYGMIKPAVAFETAMVKVKQQTKFDSADQVRELESALKQMTKTIPISLDGLAAIAAEGGNLGVAGGQLGAFTETVSKMSFVTGIAAEETATQMSKFANIMKLPHDRLSEVGDVVTFLSNRLAANSDEIMKANIQAGSMAYTFGMSTQELSALTSTFIAFGNKPETAGKTINTMINRLQLLPTASDKTKASLQALGLNMAEYQQLLADGKGQEALLRVFETLQKINGTQRAEIMKDLFGENIQRQAMSMVDRLDDYRKNLSMATDATQTAGFMQYEFAERSNTTANQLQILKNQMAVLATNVGSTLLPTITSVVGIFGRAAGTIADFAEKHPTLIKYIGLAVAGMGSLKIAGFAVGYAFTFLKGGVLTIMGVFTQARTVFSLAKLMMGGLIPVIKAVGMAFISNPIGLVIAGIAAGAVLIITNWTWCKDMFWKVSEGIGAAFDWVWQKIKGLWDGIKNIFAGIKDFFADSMVGRAWNWVFGSSDKKSKTESKPQVGDTISELIPQTQSPAIELPRSNVSNSNMSTVSVSAPITINASPGMSETEIAKQVSRELDSREQSALRRQRGVNYD